MYMLEVLRGEMIFTKRFTKKPQNLYINGIYFAVEDTRFAYFLDLLMFRHCNGASIHFECFLT